MAVRFLEILQAYEILMDPEKRMVYDRQQGFPSPEELATANPRAIVRQSEVLRKYLSNINLHSLDRDALLFQLERILSERNINLLLQSEEPDIVPAFFKEIMTIAQHLDFQRMTRLMDRLSMLTAYDPELSRAFEFNLSAKKKEYITQKYLPLLVLVITLLLCWMIYLAGKN